MSTDLPFLVVETVWTLLLAAIVLTLWRETHIVHNMAAGRDGPTLANGLPVGSPAPTARPTPRSGTLIFLSSDCRPCRDVAADVVTELAADTHVVLGGDRESPIFSGMLADLSARTRVHTDSDARRLNAIFKIRMEPFAIRVDNGVVAARGFLRNDDDLSRIRGRRA